MNPLSLSPRSKLVLLSAFFLACCLTTTAFAQWSTDPAVNTPVCTAQGEQSGPVIVSDGSGGAIIAWNDFRSGNSNVYVQRLDAAGIPKWGANGIPLWYQTATQNSVQLVSDNAGGALVLWKDYRSTDTVLYCQRVDQNGNTMWISTGVPIIHVRSNANFKMASDENGGLIIAWEDWRNGNADIYAQRIDMNGHVLWHSGGTAVCLSAGDQAIAGIASDNSGGAVVAWDGCTFVQRLRNDGSPVWQANGIKILPDSIQVADANLVSDQAGGVITTYSAHSGPYSPAYDVVVERIDSSGAFRWFAWLIYSVDQSPILPAQVSVVSSPGSITCCAHVSPMGGGSSLFRIDTSGSMIWCSPVFSGTFYNLVMSMASDGDGGVFVYGYLDFHSLMDAWHLEHVTRAGDVTWSNNGPIIDTTLATLVPEMVPDGIGGVIATWNEHRGTSVDAYDDIFAQHITENGALPIQLSSLTAELSCSAQVLVTWSTLSEVDNYGFEVQKAGARSQVYQTISHSFVSGHGTTLVAHTYAFMDANVGAGTWYYRLKQTDLDGSVHYSEPVEVTVGNLPSAFALDQNYPNPFNPSTTIRYELPQSAHVTLRIYDIIGQEVATLVDENKLAGVYSIKFDAGTLASGVYVSRIQAGSFVATRKLVLVR